MRPENSETKEQTQSRKCEIETETKKLLCDRDKEIGDRDQSSQC